MAIEFLRGPTTAIVTAAQAEAEAWADAVVTNEGEVSIAQYIAVNEMIFAMKNAGSWQAMDDAWLLVSESEVQALTSLKQLRLATAQAAPTFTADAGYAFNGSTQYIATGFIPSTHAVAMNTSSTRLDAYERTNVSATGFTCGIVGSANNGIRLRARNGSAITAECCNDASYGYALLADDSRGLTAVSRWRSALGAGRGYKNAVPLVKNNNPNNLGAALPSIQLLLAAHNNNGNAAGFRACTLGWVSIGAALSNAQELEHYNALQAYMTTKGANV